MKSFGSDNHSGVHSDILKAIAAANVEHDLAYGDDKITASLQLLFKQLIGEQAEIVPVFNGTGANVVCLQTMTRSHHGIICADTAHINVDECGAPEKHTGCKLLTVPTTDGKLTPDRVKKHFEAFGFQHHSQPKVISISQATELGTVYTPAEIKALADLAHAHDMFLHIDGSRLCNAAAALNMPFKAFTTDCGVDAFSFGGTKCGLLIGEVVVLLRPELSRDALYMRKQAAQLYSKMRFVSVQFEAFLANDLWKTLALHSNRMAALLGEELAKLPGVKLAYPVQANGVFVAMPRKVINALLKEYFFYVWNEERNEIRLMCSFDTTEEDIRAFVAAAKRLTEAI
ncbi:MAG: low specificity L-threonine aldolase [Bacteroidales bacterium]|nr:low specificity L-threonine aldolase [Bacteroidales bacterium]